MMKDIKVVYVKQRNGVSQMGWIVITIFLALVVGVILLSIFSDGAGKVKAGVDGTIDNTQRCADNPLSDECYGTGGQDDENSQDSQESSSSELNDDTGDE